MREIAERDERDRVDRLVNERMQATLLKAFGLTPDGRSGPAEDPRVLRIREQLFAAVPGLKELLEKRNDLIDIAGKGAAWAETNQTYWRGVADRTVNTLHDGVARMILGEGKTAKDLDEEARQDIRDGFIRWVDRDQTGARVQRYEAQDQALVSEYLRGFAARYLDPVRRTAAVTVGARGAARAALPIQGPAGAAPAAQPPAVDLKDEDAVHGRGWAVVQQLRAS